MENKFENQFLEERLVQALIVDHNFAEQMSDVLDLNYFGVDYLKEISSLIFGFYGEYKAFPSFRALVMIVKEKLDNKVLQTQAMQYLARIKKEPMNGDLEYIKEQALDFCRKRSLIRALENSLNLIEEQKYENIVGEIQKALTAGSERNIGHVFKDSFELRRNKEQINYTIPTPWEELNKQIRGGLWAGKLGVICAPTGVGKTHALVDLAVHACMKGFNVVHYTLELEDVDIGTRCDARFSGIGVDAIDAHKEVVKAAVDENCKGNLVIKSYPTKGASVQTLRNHYNTLILRGLKPDLIVIDYADLLKSAENYKDKRFNEEAVYEELRGWCKEIKTPCWTATQTNREGIDVEVITLKYVAECIGKAFTSDIFITANRRKDGPTPNVGNMFIAKSRLGRDGIKFCMEIDTATSKITLASEDFDSGGGGGPDGENEDYMKQQLAKKLKDFHKKEAGAVN